MLLSMFLVIRGQTVSLRMWSKVEEITLSSTMVDNCKQIKLRFFYAAFLRNYDVMSSRVRHLLKLWL